MKNNSDVYISVAFVLLNVGMHSNSIPVHSRGLADLVTSVKVQSLSSAIIFIGPLLLNCQSNSN